MEASAAAAADQSRWICRRTHTRSFLFPMESAGRLRWLSRTVRTCRVSTVKKFTFRTRTVGSKPSWRRSLRETEDDQICDILVREASKSAIRRRSIVIVLCLALHVK